MKSKSQAWFSITLVGVIFYIGIDVLLAFLRPKYSLLHNAESDYGRGPYFWVMDINFLLRFVLSLALAKGLLARFPKAKTLKSASYWLITWAVASGLLAFFADDPAGYKKIWSGPIHVLIAFIAFVAVVVAMIMVSLKLSELGLGTLAKSILVALTIIAVFSLLLLGLAGSHPHRPGGLYERVFLGSVLGWQFVLAYVSLKRHVKKPLS